MSYQQMYAYQWHLLLLMNLEMFSQCTSFFSNYWPYLSEKTGVLINNPKCFDPVTQTLHLEWWILFWTYLLHGACKVQDSIDITAPNLLGAPIFNITNFTENNPNK